MKLVALDAIAEIVRGITFSKADGSSTPDKGLLPVIRAGSIQNELLIDEGQIWVPKEKIKENQIIKKNDIIMCMSSGSSSLVGKCAKASEDWIGSFGAFCSGIRPDITKCVPSYLYYFLCSPTFRNWSGASDGANIKNIRVSELAEFQIPLPPLKTQKQIAAVLEKADQLRKDCLQMEQELNSLAQSVFIDMFGDPVTNPKGWSVVPLSTIVDDFLGGKSLVAADDLNTKFTNRVLKISAVTSGEFKPQESKPLPNDYVPQTEHFVKVGDLLFSRANTTELVGATTMVFDEYKGLVLPDKLWRFVWKDKSLLSPIFIWQQLNEAAVRKEISKLSSGSGGSMKNISKGKLKTLPVILPPLELQQKFERVYMKLREKHGSNKQQIILSEQMFNSLMQKAFSGQLNLVNAKT